jgi:hypothetical protein
MVLSVNTCPLLRVVVARPSVVLLLGPWFATWDELVFRTFQRPTIRGCQEGGKV